MNIDDLKQMIIETNNSFEEEGNHSCISLLDITPNPIIQFIELNDGTNVFNYIVEDMDTMLNGLQTKYDEDGGDDEYDHISNWLLDKHLVALFCKRLN